MINMWRGKHPYLDVSFLNDVSPLRHLQVVHSLKNQLLEIITIVSADVDNTICIREKDGKQPKRR